MNLTPRWLRFQLRKLVTRNYSLEKPEKVNTLQISSFKSLPLSEIEHGLNLEKGH